MKTTIVKTRAVHQAPGGAQEGRLPVGPRTRAEALIEGLTETGALDVRNRMLEQGASVEFTAAVIRRVLLSDAVGAYAIDEAAEAIGRSIPVRTSPKRSSRSIAPHIFGFVGPTGAGKTTTLAKLGRRLAEAGRHVLFATLERGTRPAPPRVGGIPLQTDRQRESLVSIRGANDLLAVLNERERTDIIVVDTPGLSPRNHEALNRLTDELEDLATIGPMDLYLVLPATRSSASLRLTQAAFERMQPAACVITKLDETDEPGAVLSEVARARLPIAFLCDGLDSRGHLDRPMAGDFADMILMGRRR